MPPRCPRLINSLGAWPAFATQSDKFDSYKLHFYRAPSGGEGANTLALCRVMATVGGERLISLYVIIPDISGHKRHRPGSSDVDPNRVAAAGRDITALSFHVFHASQGYVARAVRSNDLQCVANGKAILHFERRKSGHCVISQPFADELLTRVARSSAGVVLIVLGAMPLQEAVGVAAIGEAVEATDEARVERAAGDRVVDGARIELCGTRDVVM